MENPEGTGGELTIALSKLKLGLIALGAIAFVPLCIWVVTLNDVSIVRRVIVGVGIPLFGLCAVFALRKLFDTRPGLILGGQGFTDNASAVAAGFVPWADVTDIRVVDIKRQRMLMVAVKNPADYIARGGAVRRYLNRANMRMTGSPIAIPASSLKIDFDDLVAKFEANRPKFG
ncbi:hypothetical protein FZI91_08895 [Mycobacterium sp. CBMA271]|uniref:STM3941 family protein n=1 Tax=unclassified Mycobacteroides TaxID=2618759 RepID=UPI0012DCCA47|nr:MULTISPECIES: STM3941 family protein [unclassified Mycobacteroides]MUM15552.1 hypothetical protein [Mycobacteroides sp. CBMA 326]MUM17347.1 hypothetical protein [Mycobacteroides sp. CBMA 326]MUM21820.1 hypothetical protein [Mycobacteroides sp. CBMA 271]